MVVWIQQESGHRCQVLVLIVGVGSDEIMLISLALT